MSLQNPYRRSFNDPLVINSLVNILSMKILQNLLETLLFHGVQSMKREIMDNSCVNRQ